MFALEFAVIGFWLGGSVSHGQSASGVAPNDRLCAHIYGAVAGAYIGNAMGVPAEGWTWEKIEKTYGYLDRFAAKPRVKDGRGRPGWTEDGIERYKLMCASWRGRLKQVETPWKPASISWYILACSRRARPPVRFKKRSRS